MFTIVEVNQESTSGASGYNNESISDMIGWFFSFNISDQLFTNFINLVNMKNMFDVMTIFSKSQRSFFKIMTNDHIFPFERTTKINGQMMVNVYSNKTS